MDTIDDDPAVPTQAELREMLDRSEADVAAGRTVSLDEVLAELDAGIDQMTRRLARTTDAA